MVKTQLDVIKYGKTFYLLLLNFIFKLFDNVFFLILYFFFISCLSMLCSIVANFGTHPIISNFKISSLNAFESNVVHTYTDRNWEIVTFAPNWCQLWLNLCKNIVKLLQAISFFKFNSPHFLTATSFILKLKKCNKCYTGHKKFVLAHLTSGCHRDNWETLI